MTSFAFFEKSTFTATSFPNGSSSVVSLISGLSSCIYGGANHSTRYSVPYFISLRSRLGLLPAIITSPFGVSVATLWYMRGMPLVGMPDVEKR